MQQASNGRLPVYEGTDKIHFLNSNNIVMVVRYLMAKRVTISCSDINFYQYNVLSARV